MLWYNISTATAADYISACVTSSSGFQLVKWGHSFQSKSLPTRGAEIIDISTDAFTEWMNSVRDSP
uniref:Uncharacterized protein n=1 Tax=Arundo donax TaxID=35708 RepID=A0A0A9DQN1_ARUDO